MKSYVLECKPLHFNRFFYPIESMHDKDFEDVLNVPFLEGLKSQIGVIGACVQGFSAISNHS